MPKINYSKLKDLLLILSIIDNFNDVVQFIDNLLRFRNFLVKACRFLVSFPLQFPSIGIIVFITLIVIYVINKKDGTR
jgi:hypothetical protein